MSIRDRVNLVLAVWCGADPDSIDQAMSLTDLWESTRHSASSPHSVIPFQPEGVEDLVVKLGKEFKKPGRVRKDTSGLTPASFKPNGDIDSVDNLVRAVLVCPNLPAMPARGTE